MIINPKGILASYSKVFDFQNSKRWERSGDRVYKLLSDDPIRDKVDWPGYFKTVEDKTSAEDQKVDDKQEKARVVIAGVANANIEDRVQERLEPRGLIVVDYMKNPQLLAHHSYYLPIGQVEALDIQEDGIHFKAWIGDTDKAELTPMQKEIRSLVKQGIVKTVSVGFIPRKIRAPLYNDDGSLAEPLVIEEWELLELSVVAVPCNQDSIFEEIKDIKGKSMKVTNSIPASKKSEGENFEGEVLTLLRTMSEGISKNLEATNSLIDKMFEKEKPKDDDEPKDDDDSKNVSNQVTKTMLEDATKEISESVKSLSEKLDKIVSIVAAHDEAISKLS